MSMTSLPAPDNAPPGVELPKSRALYEAIAALPTSECVIWTGDTGKDGYGRLAVKRVKVGAHRWLYEVYVGPVPEGLVLDHLCRARSCVNPAHLEAVTQSVNVLRGRLGATIRARRRQVEHCSNGHRYDGLQISRNRLYRRCITCWDARVARARAKQKAAR